MTGEFDTRERGRLYARDAGDVVAIADVGDAPTFEIAEVFADGQEVGQRRDMGARCRTRRFTTGTSTTAAMRSRGGMLEDPRP